MSVRKYDINQIVYFVDAGAVVETSVRGFCKNLYTIDVNGKDKQIKEERLFESETEAAASVRRYYFLDKRSLELAFDECETMADLLDEGFVRMNKNKEFLYKRPSQSLVATAMHEKTRIDAKRFSEKYFCTSVYADSYVAGFTQESIDKGAAEILKNPNLVICCRYNPVVFTKELLTTSNLGFSSNCKSIIALMLTKFTSGHTVESIYKLNPRFNRKSIEEALEKLCVGDLPVVTRFIRKEGNAEYVLNINNLGDYLFK